MNSTEIRVPAMTGLPARTFGSIAILPFVSTSLLSNKRGNDAELLFFSVCRIRTPTRP